MARQSLVAVLALAAVVLAPLSARAFCGFYVGSADGSLVNEATMVVLLRDGTNTVLSMRNDYHGPPEDFAMVVPVPEVLDEENVKVLDAAIFDKVERLAAPRLVEYWEQDPCAQNGIGDNFGFGGLGLRGTGRGGGGTGEAAATVTVEAEFAVGEYDIVILSARDSAGLETWLHENDYRIPDGAAELLRPYVENESKFFVAKVNVDRVTFDDGRAVLSPLRVHYESESFSLPVRLGLLSAGEGKQDLIVHILANDQRYELANYDNVTIPTNLDVAPAARERFAELYAALFDETLASHPNAVVTEYAWTASSCDPCPGPSLAAQDILTLGGDVVHDGPVRIAMGGGGTIGLGNLGTIGRPVSRSRVRQEPLSVEGRGFPREVARRVIRRHINEIRFCYDQQRQSSPDLEGRMVLQLVVTKEGVVRNASVTQSSLDDDAFESCIAAAGRRWRFPSFDAGETLTITSPFVFSKPPPAPANPTPRPSGSLGMGGLGFFGGGAGPFNGWVLTRLHYRYDADDLGEDLVFREADPIMGGRENGGFGVLGAPTDEPAEISHEAQSSETNNFQGRYVIRHEWEGPIECESPRRGVWGGPWEGAENTGAGGGGGGALPATDLSRAPRGDASVLNSLIVGRGGAAEPTAEEEAEVSIAPEAETPAADTEDSGCGCRVVGPSASVPWLVLLGFSILWWRRRAYRRRP